MKIFYFCFLIAFYFDFVSSVEIIRGHRNLTEYFKGDTNLIISVPHNGLLEPNDIPDRKYGCLDNDGKCIWKHNCTKPSSYCKPTTVTDMYTREIAKYIYDIYKNKTKKNPHMIITNLKRTKMDPNREREQAAYDNEDALQVYDDYHGFIEQAKTSIKSYGLVLDIHGQGHPELWIELGYLFSKNMLNRNITDPKHSSILALSKRVKKFKFEEILRGSESFGKLLQDKSYKVVPSPAYLSPGGGRYYSGGYITKAHGSRLGGEIDCIQIESPVNLRFDDILREKYRKVLGEVVVEFMAKFYDVNKDYSSKANDKKISTTILYSSLCFLFFLTKFLF